MVIVGPTGAGKSFLADALLGFDPRIGGCTFSVCGGLTSCTNETKIGIGPWLGEQPTFTVSIPNLNGEKRFLRAGRTQRF